jgi:AcrR family transcriptional regulator
MAEATWQRRLSKMDLQYSKMRTAQIRRQTLTREAWIAAARKVLEKGGISEVKIDRLARRLEVTRGSFYFHFSSLKDLHHALLDEWRQKNCEPFQRLRETIVTNGFEFFSSVVHIWVDENPFNPRLDLSIRDWARTSRSLRKEVGDMDELRMHLLKQSFEAMGYGDDESLVRARITYFHQIGQYAISFKEDPNRRRSLQPLFGQVLVGPLIAHPGVGPGSVEEHSPSRTKRAASA